MSQVWLVPTAQKVVLIFVVTSKTESMELFLYGDVVFVIDMRDYGWLSV